MFIFLILTACTTLRAPSLESLPKGDYAASTDYLSSVIQREMKKSKHTGLSVALVDEQDVVWSEGFGYSDKANNTEATAQTQYQAGSVSKLFTALAVMQLHEKDELALDQPLVQAVPELALKSRYGSIDSITLRDTLTHHAGIPSAIVDGMWATDPEDSSAVAGKLKGAYAAYPPGEIFAYSNIGYTLAGHAIENTVNAPFPDYMRENLLQPMGMKNSNFEFNMQGPAASLSYIAGKPVTELGLRDIPAGGLVTTVEDLSNLVRMIHADGMVGHARLIETATQNEMLRRQQYNHVLDFSAKIGVGWFHFNDYLGGEFQAVGHGGQTMAHSALVVTLPELKLGVALLANSPNADGSLERIAKEIIRIAYTVKTGLAAKALFQPLGLADLPGDESSFSGRYASEFGLINITGNGKYSAEVAGQTFKLEAEKVGGYKLKYKLLGLIPVSLGELDSLTFWPRNIAGYQSLVATQDNQKFLIGTQVKTEVENDTWNSRLGQYKLSNPIETDVSSFKIQSIRLRVEDQLYLLEIQGETGTTSFPLSLVNDSEATFQGWGRGLGETITARPDGSIEYAGLVFRRPDN